MTVADFLIAAILGIVQGLTEFLPVSSSGHLVILERLTGSQLPALTFHVFLHAGTTLAVILAMREELLLIVRETADMGRDFAGVTASAVRPGGETGGRGRSPRSGARREAAVVLIITAVSGVMGALLIPAAAAASGSVLFSGIGLMMTGILLLVTDMVKMGGEISPHEITSGRAVLIGAAQGISILPGISRSAFTVCTGIFSGIGRKNAVTFSYLISVPVTLGMLVYVIASGIPGGVLTLPVLGCCLVGTSVSAVVGSFMIRRCLVWFRRCRWGTFARYCFIAGFAAVLISFS